MSLTTQPSSDVTVNIASDDPTTVTVTPTPLIFTPGNWATAQTVTVTGVNDADTSDEALSVTLSTTSTDIDYDTTTASVSVTVTDDDTAALVVSQNSVTVDENGTATFDVNLATQPSASVTVTLATGNTAVATVSHAALTFTTSDWNTPQTVTINGTDDTNADTDSTIITVTATNGGYDDLTAQATVTVTDDDEPPDPPGTPENVQIVCDSQGATVSWESSASGGQPDTYAVEVTFYGTGTIHPQTISHPTTEADYPLGSGFYRAYVQASNSAGDSLNLGSGYGSC